MDCKIHMNFTKTQKSGYLENKALFFLQIKTLYIKGCFIAKNSFLGEETFKLKERNVMECYILRFTEYQQM